MSMAVLAVALALAGAVVFAFSVRAYLRYRGRRLVVCPETGKPAAVALDAAHAAATSVGGRAELRLSACSRWPERQGCGQECLAQIENIPDGCLVASIVADWYRRRTCAYCGKPFGEIRWTDHRPALLAPDGRSVQWHEVAAERLPELFATHRPICWNCHIVESFIRAYPDLVVERRGRDEAAPRVG